eukprot:723071_1
MAPDIDSMRSSHVTHKKNGLLYYTAHGGLMYGGTCRNYSCGAYGQKLTFERGYGINIDVLKEINEKDFGCPGCNRFFELKEFILYQCDARVVYKKDGKNMNTNRYSYKKSKFDTKMFNVYGNEVIHFGSDDYGESVQVNYMLLEFNVFKEREMNMNDMIDDAESDDDMKDKVDGNDETKDLIHGKAQRKDYGSGQNEDNIRNNKQSRCCCCIL